MLRYLDTTALAEQLDMTLAALRHSEETDQGPVGPINQQRALILEKARAAVAPNLNTDMRRDPRTPCVVAARVRIGLPRILQELSQAVRATPTALIRSSAATSRSRCTPSRARFARRAGAR